MAGIFDSGIFDIGIYDGRFPTVSGSINRAESSGDYIASPVVGDVFVKGRVSATEGTSDSAVVLGDVFLKGSFASTDAIDTLSIPYGDVFIKGSASASETTRDTIVVEGSPIARGTLSAAEVGADTIISSGRVDLSGSIDSSDTEDTARIRGKLGAYGATVFYVIYPYTLSAPSAAQIAAGQDSTGSAALASGWQVSPLVDTTLLFNELAEGLVAASGYIISFVWYDGFDYSNVATSEVFYTEDLNERFGTLAATEVVTDTATVLGKVRAYGSFSQAEASTDTAAVSGNVYVKGTSTLTETGPDAISLPADAIATAVFLTNEVGQDTFLAQSNLIPEGDLIAVEDTVDSFAGTMLAYVMGTVNAPEISVDTSQVSGRVLVGGTGLTTQEAGPDISFTYGVTRYIEAVHQLEVSPTANEADPVVADNEVDIPDTEVVRKVLVVSEPVRRMVVSG